MGGSRSARPKMSVRKPGVIRKAAPEITATPSWTSRWGIRPLAMASLKRRHTLRPCVRSSTDPSTESAASSSTVQRIPIESPTLKITYSSARGSTMNRAARAGSGIGPTLSGAKMVPWPKK